MAGFPPVLPYAERVIGTLAVAEAGGVSEHPWQTNCSCVGRLDQPPGINREILPTGCSYGN